MNPWTQSPQTWIAYGLEWHFKYIAVTAKRTITASGFNLDVPILAVTKFPSPQAWLDAWAKKNKAQLPPEPETAVNLELDLFPQPEAVQVEVVTLTPEEERDRLLLERQVERAFYQAGKALKKLRDRRLYRSTHPNFEEYCHDRFGYSRRKMDYLIAGAEVFENLQVRTIGSQSDEPETRTNGSQLDELETRTICSQTDEPETRTICSQILPTRENQVRPLTQLEPSQQREVWQKAVTEAGGKVPSGRLVKDIVQRIRERTKVPNPYRVGEVCQFIVKDNPELRGKGGCWCIVSEVHEFSCTVTTWEGDYTVRLEHLKSMDYKDSECQGMKDLCGLAKRVPSAALESASFRNNRRNGSVNSPKFGTA